MLQFTSEERIGGLWRAAAAGGAFGNCFGKGTDVEGGMLKRLHAGQHREKSGGKIFGILFFTVFVIVFGTAGVTMIHYAYVKEKTYSMMTTGTVVDYNDYSVNNDHKYAPIVEYRVKDQVFVSDTNIRFNFRPFKKGAHVSVYYNPESPGESYIKEYDLKATYKLGAIFLLVTIPFCRVVFGASNVLYKAIPDFAKSVCNWKTVRLYIEKRSFG